eukprot:jgi/Botrbrau1/21426/Bobra.0216s0041.2
MSVADWAPFLRFAGSEIKELCNHLASAAEQFASTGGLPESKFGGENLILPANGEAGKDVGTNAKQAKPRPEKRTRKPSAFNYYIKKTVEDLKKQGIKPKEGEGEGGQKESYLTLAVDKWNTLSEIQRKEYIESHKHEFDDVPTQEDAGLLTPVEEAPPALQVVVEEPANGAQVAEIESAKKDKKKKKEKKRKSETGPETEEPAVGSGDESNEDIKKKKKKKKKEREGGPASG